jgi:hypothetical protein
VQRDIRLTYSYRRLVSRAGRQVGDRPIGPSNISLRQSWGTVLATGAKGIKGERQSQTECLYESFLACPSHVEALAPLLGRQ